MKLAKLIPRICHSVNRCLILLTTLLVEIINFFIRVVWVFGKAVLYPVVDVTPTHLSQGVLATLREADYVAHSILKYNGEKQNFNIHFFAHNSWRCVILCFHCCTK